MGGGDTHLQRAREVTISSMSRATFPTDIRGTASLPHTTLTQKGCMALIKLLLTRLPGGQKAQACRSAPQQKAVRCKATQAETCWHSSLRTAISSFHLSKATSQGARCLVARRLSGMSNKDSLFPATTAVSGNVQAHMSTWLDGMSCVCECRYDQAQLIK